MMNTQKLLHTKAPRGGGGGRFNFQMSLEFSF